MKVKIGDAVMDNIHGLLYVVVDICGRGQYNTYATMYRIIEYPNGFGLRHMQLNIDHTIRYWETWKKVNI